MSHLPLKIPVIVLCLLLTASVDMALGQPGGGDRGRGGPPGGGYRGGGDRGGYSRGGSYGGGDRGGGDRGVVAIAVVAIAVGTVEVDHLEARATSFDGSTPTATGCLTRRNLKVAPKCSWIASWDRFPAST